MPTIRCSWCGESVGPGEGFRLREEPGERRAAFCRLEHVVPWALRGAHWDPGSLSIEPALEAEPRCARCARPLTRERVTIVRHRGHHRIIDAFCGVDHLLEWAKAGGRWA